MDRIFIVTPLRDEMDNIDRLIEALSSQSCEIEGWIVVENGSTDGSAEYLDSLTTPPNIKNFFVLHVDTDVAEYAVGGKYAKIVKKGFDEFASRFEIEPADFIGICDADSFPEPDYYIKLLRLFSSDPGIGIAGGLSLEDGEQRISHHSQDWVRGSCRLWRGACFLQSGYVVGPSADALSAARAQLDGWRVTVAKDAFFRARVVGERTKQGHYGRTVYFRGHSLWYAVFRTLKLFSRGDYGASALFFKGYWEARKARIPQLEDPELREFFKTYLRRKVLKYIRDRVRSS